ncbi:MAG: cytochrome c oxidase subunit II [Sandaracinaceae bacterium]
MELMREILFLPPGASSVADELDALHFTVIAATMLGSAVTFAVALRFIVRYRRRHAHEPTPRVVAPRPLEAAVVTGLLALFVGLWGVGYRQYASLRLPPDDALTCHVIVKQWMWTFVGPEGRRSQGILVVPADRDVELRLTSRDVIHSLFVPAFRIKQDALPERITTSWFRAERPGVYPILCAEYCGAGHSRMRASVVVLDAERYARWLDDTELGALADLEGVPEFQIGEEADSTAHGREVAARYGCLACHTLDGQPHVGPSWRGLYGSTVELEGGGTILADDDYLTESMMEPEARRVAGYATVMPTYRGTLGAPDTAALVELIRSLADEGPAPEVELPRLERREPAERVTRDAGAPGSDAAPRERGAR